MCKTAGILLILVSATGIGMHFCLEMTKRKQILETLMRMVLLIKGELRYGNASLHDVFSDSSRRMTGEYADFLKTVSVRMQDSSGKSFGKIFDECAKEKLPLSVLTADEREAFCFLGTQLGYLDLTMQIRQLELYEEELNRCLETLRVEMPAKRKVYQSLGIFGGILLAILVW